MRALAAVALTVAAACGDAPRATIAVDAPPELVATFEEFVEFIPAPGLAVAATGEGGASRYRIDVAIDLGGCAECYRVDAIAEDAWRVHASDRLGAQYGVAEVFELLGFRFRHPFDTYVPARPTPDPAAVAALGRLHQPEMTVRGLHLHTLHPIEALGALWTPGDGGRRGRQIFDWIVKNRGNLVQWVALDDILDDTRHAAWQVATAELVAAAHRRGLRAGLGFQIFGVSSLQNGYDLIDDPDRPVTEQIAARLPRIVDGVPFDVYALSFGEFFGAAPAEFIATVNEVYAALHARAPQAEVTAVIHVGDSPDQRVVYMGENLIYYFLVKFADPRIVPQVHTTMYYNLFDDAGGAYHHQDFGEHRQFLLDRLRAGLRVQYKPETAYWVAFDNSVPMYLPLYLVSRQRDRDLLRQAASARGHDTLREELLFSSGWEWGYWQNDAASLRAEYETPVSDLAPLAHFYAPDHPELPARILELARAQFRGLIEDRLAPYQAGRDALIDLGVQAGIIAAPDRVDVDDVATLTPAARAAFAADVGAKLDAYAARTTAIAARTLQVPATDRWAAEVIDGVALVAERARFVAVVYRAAIAAADGDGATAAAALAEAELIVTAAGAIVARRHADLHDPTPELVEEHANPTQYQYGYLRMADTLCFWRRELVMAANAVRGETATPPGCFFP